MCLLVQNHWVWGGNRDKHPQHNSLRSHFRRSLSRNIIKLHLAFTLYWFVQPSGALSCNLRLQAQCPASVTHPALLVY